MLENISEQHQQVVDKFIDPAANVTMTQRDYVVRASANNITGAIRITLPPVSAARGRFYSILARDAGIVNTITITDNNSDSECWLNDIILNAPCQRVMLYSDGLAWIPLGPGPGNWPGISTTIAPATDVTTVAPTTISTRQGTTLAATTVAPTTLGTTVAPTTVL